MFKAVLTTIALAASLLIGAAAQATIITIDSTDPNNGTTLSLGAGDYRVDLIQDQYIAWNAWGRETGCDGAGQNCTRGWINSYVIESIELGRLGVGDSSVRFATAMQAFDTAMPFFFTLSSTQDVEFFRPDSNFNDNEGGLSLRLTDVSEPATLALLGLGVIAFAALRRRRA